jgi:hypothetical protein
MTWPEPCTSDRCAGCEWARSGRKNWRNEVWRAWRVNCGVVLVSLVVATLSGNSFEFLLLWCVREADTESGTIITNLLPIVLLNDVLANLGRGETIEVSVCPTLPIARIVTEQIRHRGSNRCHRVESSQTELRSHGKWPSVSTKVSA